MYKIKKAAEEVGIISEVIDYKSDVTEKEILEKIHKLNLDKNINGILVQLTSSLTN